MALETTKKGAVNKDSFNDQIIVIVGEPRGGMSWSGICLALKACENHGYVYL